LWGPYTTTTNSYGWWGGGGPMTGPSTTNRGPTLSLQCPTSIFPF